MDRLAFAALIRRAIKNGLLAPHSIIRDGKPRVIVKLATDQVRGIPSLVEQLGGQASMYVLHGDTACSLELAVSRGGCPNLFLNEKTLTLDTVLSTIRYPAGSRWVMRTGGVLLEWRCLATIPTAELGLAV